VSDVILAAVRTAALIAFAASLAAQAPPSAAALATDLLAAMKAHDDAAARRSLDALVELRGDAHPALAVLVSELPELSETLRPLALRAIGNGVLFCADDEVRQRTATMLRAYAQQELFYSPAKDAPSMLWYEYVRALRRIDVRARGADHDALLATLQSFLVHRKQSRAMLGRLPGNGGNGNQASVYDLTSYGWHGAQEVLEAVAELAERHGDKARDLAAELQQFLAFERPSPIVRNQEGVAGCGESPPVDTPALHFPVLWVDDYRIALAHALVAIDPAAARTTAADQHLLYSPRRADRLDAIARLRSAPLTEAAVTHLVAQLRDRDRLVVREVISALGSGGPAARAARPYLQKIADGFLQKVTGGDDKELRAIAARALQQLDDK
jgi:hypothetical protein